jgi:predicted MPP superfamily phosphohydrolase
VVSTRITELKVENLPKSLHDFKITFISDTQADWYTDYERITNYIETANATNPDIILLAGDVITGTPRYIQKGADALGKLKAKYGVFTCVGDHDNWAYREDNARSLREISTALSRVGVEMVDDDIRIVNVDSASIKIAFATYTYSRRIQQRELEQLANGNGEHDVDIFLTHQPNEFMVDIISDLNYDLYLAGHTHGGQLTILFPFLNLTPTLMETKYVKGDFFLDDLKIIVNRGLGMSIAPVRYNSTPEVTVVVLKNQN